MTVTIAELTILMIAAFIIGVLFTHPGQIIAYSKEDYICAKQNVTELKENTKLHEECHVLVWDDWEHYCTAKDAIEWEGRS